MNRYLVGYDLLKPGQNYDGLTNALAKLGAKRVLLSEWVVVTNLNAVQLRDYLKQFIDTTDRLLVNDFSEWASWSAMTDLNKMKAA